ncbi:hypothetical protein M0813_28301 [Anaeramoeba flamelloides]|uniref:SREBP regulating gene protein n=1 Tax=Anaeramoeba flamelloides TaxID=1746091 RepID=A0ABQ8XUJ2_9EUKA|nr:hypothetical protein M0813_28301 [Anaeramoeba flamelloides]
MNTNESNFPQELNEQTDQELIRNELSDSNYSQNQKENATPLPNNKSNSCLQFLLGLVFVVLIILTFMLVIHFKTTNTFQFTNTQRVLNQIEFDQNDLETPTCSNTVQGKLFITDSKGYVCKRLDLDLTSNCCPTQTFGQDQFHQFSCYSCSQKDKCCQIYEFCVSCCMDPSNQKSQNEKNSETTKLFEICKESCRTSSKSIGKTDLYLSNLKFCYDEKIN